MTRVVQAETENNSRALTTAGRREITNRDQPESNVLAELTVQEVIARHRKIQQIINEVLTPDVDYGIVPGTSRMVNGKETAKPSLFKSGAEKIATAFLLDAEFDNTLTYDGDHLTVTSYCTLYHIPTANRVGSGSAICSTRESKYAYRFSGLKCPKCGKETLIHTKRSPTDWWCSSYKDGCGENFKPDAPGIVGQERGQVANDKLPDQYNTIIKMAEKRAKVGAIIGATGASEFVTQDLEDLADNGVIVDTEKGGSTASETKKAGDTKPDGQKTAETKPKGAKKSASEGAAEKKDTPPAGDVITDDDVAEMTLICEVLESDPEDILAFYKVKDFKEMNPGQLKHFRQASAQAAERDKKDLPALLAAAKAKKK